MGECVVVCWTIWHSSTTKAASWLGLQLAFSAVLIIQTSQHIGAHIGKALCTLLHHHDIDACQEALYKKQIQLQILERIRAPREP
jgi:hypothetical protein